MKFSGILLLVILSTANALPGPGYPIAAMSKRLASPSQISGKFTKGLPTNFLLSPIAERSDPDPGKSRSIAERSDPDPGKSRSIAERSDPDPGKSRSIAERSDCRYPDTRSYPIAER